MLAVACEARRQRADCSEEALSEILPSSGSVHTNLVALRSSGSWYQRCQCEGLIARAPSQRHTSKSACRGPCLRAGTRHARVYRRGR